MRWRVASGLGLIAAGLWVAPPAAAADAVFRVNGVELHAPLPAGYCLPEGAELDVSQALAAGDPANVTHLALDACGARKRAGPTDILDDYMLVKTPKSALLATVTREQLLEGLGAAFENPELAAALASGKIMENAEKSMTEVLGREVDLTGTVKPLGKDDVCAYLGGTLTVTSPERSYTISVGVCITAVGGRVVSVNWYGPDHSPAGIARLLLKAKGFAGTIRSRPAS